MSRHDLAWGGRTGGRLGAVEEAALLRMDPFRFVDGVALVTGAASGIGASLAHELASRGMRLALVDRDGAGLARTAAAARLGGAPA